MTRVATFNMLHGMDLATGDGSDLEATAAVIEGLGADVVALQEVDRGLPRSGGVDQVAHLCAVLGPGWEGVFAPALLGDPNTSWRVPGTGDGTGDGTGAGIGTRGGTDDPDGPAYGIAVLSRRGLSEPQRLALPGGGPGHRTDARRAGWDREPRTALRVVIGGTDDPSRLHVTTTHLSYLPWRGLAQLRRVARWAAAPPGPAVLAGDLNLPAGVVRGALPRWQHAGGDPTYPASAPRVQVDQILVRDCAATGARVIPTTSSDHLPLVADLAPEAAADTG